MAAAGGTELMATNATFAYQPGYSLLTFDAQNASSSMKRRAILPALVELIPPVMPFALRAYASEELPKLPFKMDSGETGIVRSSTRVQQECNLGPLYYGARLLKLLRQRLQGPSPSCRCSNDGLY